MNAPSRICLLCGNDHLNPLGAGFSKDTCACPSCGMVTRWDRLESSDEFDRYQNDQAPEVSEDWILGRQRTFLSSLPKLELYRKTGHILDVGAGMGFFAGLCKDHGWSVSAIEPSPGYCRFARERFNLEMIEGTIEAASLPEAHFDAITLWNVLDQMLNPVQSMAALAPLLRPGGVMIIRCPNPSLHIPLTRAVHLVSLIRPTLGRRNPATLHLHGFPARTMRRLLRINGFDRIHVRPARLAGTRGHGDRSGLLQKAVMVFAETTGQTLAVASGGALLLSPSWICEAVTSNQ